MNKYFDSHFNKNIVTLYPGEYYSTSENELISTVLGSCISIAVYDSQSNFGGMNHFMLARDSKLDNDKNGLMGRFGEYAIELLLNDMFKKGATRTSITAKIFGGSNVFNMQSNSGALVGDVNIKFAFDYLEREGIPVLTSDTGGIQPRKIFFDPRSAKVWLKRINSTQQDTDFIIKQESSYLEKIKKQEESAGTIAWF